MSYAVVRIQRNWVGISADDRYVVAWPYTATPMNGNHGRQVEPKVDLLDGPFDTHAEAHAAFLFRIGATPTVDVEYARRITEQYIR